MHSGASELDVRGDRLAYSDMRVGPSLLTHAEGFWKTTLFAMTIDVDLRG
jgi:hypothetical protein